MIDYRDCKDMTEYRAKCAARGQNLLTIMCWKVDVFQRESGLSFEKAMDIVTTIGITAYWKTHRRRSRRRR